MRRNIRRPRQNVTVRYKLYGERATRGIVRVRTPVGGADGVRMMAYDAEPGQEPQHAFCPGCQRAILQGSPATRMHFAKDPYGTLGLSGELWHADCASGFWDNSAETLRRWGLADRT